MRLFHLSPGGRLDRYVGSLFVGSYAVALLLVVGLAVIFDLASNLSYFEDWEDGTNPGTATVARYYFFNVPFVFLQVAPYVTLVAGLFTLSKLNKSNEITAALAAGVSAQRLLTPLLFGGALCAAGMFALREHATNTLGAHRDALRDLLENQRHQPVHENVWLRDAAGNVARLGQYIPESPDAGGGPEICNLQATLKSGGVWHKLTADRAVWVEHDGRPRWALTNGQSEVVRVSASRQAIDELRGIEITPEDVRVRIKELRYPLEMSFREVNRQLARDPENQALQTLMQYHLTFPLANVVLLLVGLPSLLGRERGKSGEGLMIGLLLCVFYFCTEFVCRELGVEGVLTPLFASWLPTLIFGSLGLALFDTMRT